MLARRIAINFRVWSYDFESDWKWIIEKAKKTGYDALEVPLFTYDAKVSEYFHESNVTPIITLGGNPESDPSSKYSYNVKKGEERIMAGVNLCAELGGSLVIGPMYSFAGKLEYLSLEERKQKIGSLGGTFADLGKYAEKEKVRLAIEPLCRYDNSIINTVDEGLELVKSTGKENVGLLLDTFHMNIEEKSIEEAIIAAGRNGKLFHFHACENDRGIPGTGLINWLEVKAALDAVKYDGLISVESFAPENPRFSTNFKIWRRFAQTQDEFAEKSIAFLRANLA